MYRGSNDPIGFQGVLVLLVTIFLYRFAYIAGKIIISTTYTIPKTMKHSKPQNNPFLITEITEAGLNFLPFAISVTTKNIFYPL